MDPRYATQHLHKSVELRRQLPFTFKKDEPLLQLAISQPIVFI